MSAIRSAILKEVDSERGYQEGRWGNDTDDKLNTPWMWAAYIAGYATKWMAGTFLPLKYDVTTSFRKCMIKVAAIAVAAAESVDRQRAEKGVTFYEEK